MLWDFFFFFLLMLCRFNEITLNTILSHYAFIFCAARPLLLFVNVNVICAEILCFSHAATMAILLRLYVRVIFAPLIFSSAYAATRSIGILAWRSICCLGSELYESDGFTNMPVDEMILDTRCWCLEGRKQSIGCVVRVNVCLMLCSAQ